MSGHPNYVVRAYGKIQYSFLKVFTLIVVMLIQMDKDVDMFLYRIN